MERMPQNLKNHAKWDPWFHFLLTPVVVLNLTLIGFTLTDKVDRVSLWGFLLAAAAVVAIFKIRIYPLQVQDRLIRLEERLRLHELIADPAKRALIPKLTEDQLIGLRFASDEEAPALMEQALANNWKRADIKKAIRNWRPDYFRI